MYKCYTRFTQGRFASEKKWIKWETISVHEVVRDIHSQPVKVKRYQKERKENTENRINCRKLSK